MLDYEAGMSQRLRFLKFRLGRNHSSSSRGGETLLICFHRIFVRWQEGTSRAMKAGFSFIRAPEITSPAVELPTTRCVEDKGELKAPTSSSSCGK